jgi:raffinose/stachyose/melibiose transport system permease protein
MEKMLRDKRIILLFVLPALLIYVVVVPLPLLTAIGLSFTDWDLLNPIKFVGLRNFDRLFTVDYVFWQAVRNTLVYMFGSIILQIPLAFFLASLLFTDLKGRNIFRTVFFLPVTLSGAAVALMWYFFYHPNVGLINQVVRLFGSKDFSHPWLAEESTALAAVIASVAWQWAGYHMVLCLTGMSSISKNLFDAAKIDGASNFQLSMRIVLPLVLPILSVSAILITTSSLKSFDSIWLMTQGEPQHATEVIASHMYIKTFLQQKYGYGAALGVVLFVLCIGSTLIIRKSYKVLEKRHGG